MKLTFHKRVAQGGSRKARARKSNFRSSRLRCGAARSVAVNEVTVPATEVGVSSSRNKVRRPASAARGRSGRIIVVAVDGTDEGVEGLQWLVENCFKAGAVPVSVLDTGCAQDPLYRESASRGSLPVQIGRAVGAHVVAIATRHASGDYIELVTVVNNDRAMPISVGMTSPTGRVLTISLDEDFGYERTKAYGERLADEAQAAIDTTYRPIVESAGLEVATAVRIVEGHASAASIAESVVAAANEAGAGILAVTSHGGGLKCSYGSVARYCVTHFHRAVFLIPPGMSSHTDRSEPSMSIGINHVKELQDATCWGVDHLLHDGDKLHVLRAEEAEMTRGDSTHQNVIMAGLREQLQKHNIKDMTYTLLQPKGAAEVSSEEMNELYAAELLRKATEKRSKALVMVNYATRGLMQEMMFGTLAMMVSRSASMPLALVPPDYAVE